jgi:hypothetical protein
MDSAPSPDPENAAERPAVKLYLRVWFVVVMLLSVGPLALPLLWLSPAFKLRWKIIVTIFVAVMTFWTWQLSVTAWQRIQADFNTIRSLLYG